MSSIVRTLLTPALPLVQWRDARRIKVEFVRLPNPRGIRLVLVSDIHARADWFPQSHVARVVDRVNEVRDAHAVLLLGDYVGDDVTAIDWAAPELARIRRPAYGVLGNHDHWTDPGRIARALEEAGVTMLTNRATPSPVDGVWFAGIDSCWGGDPQPERALAGVPEGADCIVLGHEPHLATMHEEYLHLAGHSHNGQVRIPLLSDIVFRQPYVRYSEPYPGGFYARAAESYVYTTAGVGYSTVSFRVGCPPEIVVVDA